MSKTEKVVKLKQPIEAVFDEIAGKYQDGTITDMLVIYREGDSTIIHPQMTATDATLLKGMCMDAIDMISDFEGETLFYGDK